MDLEGYCRRELEKERSEKEILAELTNLIIKIKFGSNLNEIKKAEALADAVLDEVKKTKKEIKNKFVKDLLTSPKAGVKMGEIGVGSRGEGDFFVHRKIGKLASIGASIGAKAVILPDAQDDAGVVETDEGSIVVVTVDGTHSRLSNYPFIAGFHVARAALRDIYVNGGNPVALLDDLHLSDDGDVGRLFDFIAGISVVSELTGVPLVAGSTLRVGGDMVIGERMVSCVGAVGIAREKKHITARKNIKPGDKILMTSGAGGGTIATTAIYSGNFDTILETLNVDFIKASEAIYNSGLLNKIHAMLDVTNGGIRGDANEVVSKLNENIDSNNKTNKIRLVFYEPKIKNLVNKKVFELLKNLNIDYLGVSIDSLMIFAPPENCNEIIEVVRNSGVKIDIVGEVVSGDKAVAVLVDEHGNEKELKPLFREAGYTKIKKVVGEKTPEKFEEMKNNVERAYEEAVEKRNKILEFIKKRIKKRNK